MASKLKCSLCNELATVHLTQIINNEIKKIDLCEECAQKKGVTDKEGFSFAEMLTNVELKSRNSQQSCKYCSLSVSEFKNSGRFGCASCYKEFKDLLMPIIDEMHISCHHKGKLPVKYSKNITINEEINSIKEKLENAIKIEAYEDAAKYRDHLNELTDRNRNE